MIKMNRTNAGSRDVAREAGVSQATVSYVLNNTPNVKIKPETRQLVLDAAKRLNYHANTLARGMRMKKTECIGVVSRKNMSSSVFMNVLEGIRAGLSEHNYSINLCLSSESGTADAEYIKYYNSRIIDGVIFVFTTLSDEEKRALAENNVPYVMIYALADEDEPYLVKPNIDGAVNEAVAYLVDKGITEIGYLGKLTGNLGTRRFASFNAALDRHSLETVGGVIHKISGNEDKQEAEIEQFFAERGGVPPRALFCEGINAGMYLLRYAYKNGIRIPGDMSVICIGTSQYSKRMCPSLSAIESPLHEMGQSGVRMLFERLDGVFDEDADGRVRSSLQWQFVKRESC